jgi:hypothetical protein
MTTQPERVIVNNTAVGEIEGDTLVITCRAGNHRRRYIIGKDRIVITVRGVTQEITPPWARDD